jgi:GTP diphosphokinase / guanosine-3',5'-bis(diphosphate) 3'-diphosphatase
MSNALILKAARYAAHKHRKQKRKDKAQTPYINHPIAVAETAARVGGIDDPEVLAAALLHDVVEDWPKTKKQRDGVIVDIRRKFGEAVIAYALEVTDDKWVAKQERKKRQIAHAANLSPGATAIKLADKTCNVTDVYTNPPTDWSDQCRREYLDWAEKVIENCPKANEPLLTAARGAIANGRKALGL